MSNLVQLLADKATARLPTHCRTHTRRSVKLSITTEYRHPILGIHASTVHGATARVRQKRAYTWYRSSRIGSSTTHSLLSPFLVFIAVAFAAFRHIFGHWTGYSKCEQLIFNTLFHTATCNYPPVSAGPLLFEQPQSRQWRLLSYWK